MQLLIQLVLEIFSCKASNITDMQDRHALNLYRNLKCAVLYFGYWNSGIGYKNMKAFSSKSL